MEEYETQYFSISTMFFFCIGLILSTLESWKGFMENGAIVDMHERIQLRSDLTKPYVK